MRISDWSSDVFSSDLAREGAAPGEVLRITCGTGIVGREQARIAEAVVHQPQVEGAGENVVARVIGIGAEPEPDAHLGPGSGHQLHDAYRARRRADRPAVQPRAASALGLHHRLEPRGRHPARTAEHKSGLQSLMSNSYDVCCLKQKKHTKY